MSDNYGERIPDVCARMFALAPVYIAISLPASLEKGLRRGWNRNGKTRAAGFVNCRAITRKTRLCYPGAHYSDRL